MIEAEDGPTALDNIVRSFGLKKFSDSKAMSSIAKFALQEKNIKKGHSIKMKKISGLSKMHMKEFKNIAKGAKSEVGSQSLDKYKLDKEPREYRRPPSATISVTTPASSPSKPAPSLLQPTTTDSPPDSTTTPDSTTSSSPSSSSAEGTDLSSSGELPGSVSRAASSVLPVTPAESKLINESIEDSSVTSGRRASISTVEEEQKRPPLGGRSALQRVKMEMLAESAASAPINRSIVVDEEGEADDEEGINEDNKSAETESGDVDEQDAPSSMSGTPSLDPSVDEAATEKPSSTKSKSRRIKLAPHAPRPLPRPPRPLPTPPSKSTFLSKATSQRHFPTSAASVASSTPTSMNTTILTLPSSSTTLSAPSSPTLAASTSDLPGFPGKRRRPSPAEKGAGPFPILPRSLRPITAATQASSTSGSKPPRDLKIGVGVKEAFFKTLHGVEAKLCILRFVRGGKDEDIALAKMATEAEVPTWEDLLALLPPKECRYIVYNLDWIPPVAPTSSPTIVHTPLFLLWTPGQADMADKMLTSAFNSLLLKRLEEWGEIPVTIQSSSLSTLKKDLVVKTVQTQLATASMSL